MIRLTRFASRPLWLGPLFFAACVEPVRSDSGASKGTSAGAGARPSEAPGEKKAAGSKTDPEKNSDKSAGSAKGDDESASSSSGAATSSSDASGADTAPNESKDETSTQEQKGELHGFMRKLNGSRPCAEDSPVWVEVESYRGTLSNYPIHVVENAEKRILSGACSATLIGPELAITAAQCDPKPGDRNFHLRVQLDSAGNERTPIETEVIEVVERSYSLENGFEYSVVRLSGRPGDRWGWTKLAAVELRNGDPLALIHAPFGKSEKVGSGRFLQHGRGGFAMSQSLHSDKGSVGAGLLDSAGFLVGVQAAGSCCDSGIEGCEQGKEVGWHSLIHRAWKNSERLREIVSVWQVGGPGVQFAGTGDGQLFGLVPNRSSVWRMDSPDEWTQIGGAATEIFAGKRDLYRRTESQLYRYQGGEDWEPVGGEINAGDQFVMDLKGNELYRLPASQREVQRLAGGRWDKIGGPASRLFPAPGGVFAEHPDNKGMYRWSPSENDWLKVSGATDQVVEGSDGVIFRRDAEGVFMKRDQQWEKIGGPAEELIIGGNDELYAIHSEGQRIWRFDMKTKGWSLFGRPSKTMVRMGSRFFAVEKSSGHIVEYRMP